MTIAAMKAALEALEYIDTFRAGTARLALRAAISEQEKCEPVAEAGWLECIPYERSCDHLDEFNEVGQAYADGWNACRKAMLQAAPKPGEDHD